MVCKRQKLSEAVGHAHAHTHTHTDGFSHPSSVFLLLMLGTQGSHTAICSQLSHSLPLLLHAYHFGSLA